MKFSLASRLVASLLSGTVLDAVVVNDVLNDENPQVQFQAQAPVQVEALPRVHRVLQTETTGIFLLSDIQFDGSALSTRRHLQSGSDSGNGNGNNHRPHQTLNVELDDGTIYEFENLPPGFQKNGLLSGRTTISLPAGTAFSSIGKADTKGGAPAFVSYIRGDKHSRRRRLTSAKEGTRTVLAVRVVVSDGATSVDAATLSDGLFGNGVDPVTLASQYRSCSHGRLEFVKAPDRSGMGAAIVDGVVTLTLPSASVASGDGALRNAITLELYNAFGLHPGQLADHVMYCLPSGAMGGIAYAYVDSWNSVYSDEWCTYVSAQMHEIGHNLNFAHSNEAGTYGDQTGMMGLSYPASDTSMCFNGAKSWQAGWYADKEVTVDSAVTTCFSGDLHGIVDYPTATTVLVKVRDDANLFDYFVNFNAKKDFNAQTQEAGNLVTVTRTALAQERDTYAESELVAKLDAGASFAFAGYNLSVGDVDAVAGKAQVTILPDGQTACAKTTTAPSLAPSMDPSLNPSASSAPSPTDVSHRPSLAPSFSPSDAPLGKLDFYQSLDLLGDCTVDTRSGRESVLCSYYAVPSLPDDPALATVYSKLVLGSCAESPAFVASDAANGGIADATTPSLDMLVTLDEKNCDPTEAINGECVVVRPFCSRGDVIDNDAKVSVRSLVVGGDATFTYRRDGSFSTDVATADFVADVVSADATRTVAVRVFRGECGSPDTTCEIGGVADCFETGGLAVGSTLHLCLVPADEDVRLTSLRSVVAAAGTPPSSVSVEWVDDEGSPNFVTRVVVEEDGKGITLSSLMTPAYYDAQDGGGEGSVSVTGTVVVEYVASGSGRKLVRLLQATREGEENTPFSISVPLETKTLPQIASRDNVVSGSGSFFRIGWVSVGVLSAAMWVLL
mmetsp:Transcript_31023/g.65438  ORF Transcript_31023/g.65438 Transcript_31023/m.65438 type:complete len:898 (+) Transcript_31023:360-3053(+)|eukprot:CAMPEP_0171329250 /NCGR_PEP_ID=MMETSP0878-20121228/1153_1 /TAXON_ID=67004 /ORGANISM="Thalassiosira weissflogii, Strain CCMP1336" /LENGTH=897 /DNA_ID=CAMNT_0011829211 /DNA_START=160 /DNA_END=2853 /DNA_ORIENTATION=-